MTTATTATAAITLTEHVVFIRVRDAMVHACEIWERCGSAEDAAASCLTAERMGHRVDRVEIVTR